MPAANKNFRILYPYNKPLLEMKKTEDTWNSGSSYEYFMGRWSKMMAPVFLEWFNVLYNLSWFDIGCGTGAFRNIHLAVICSHITMTKIIEEDS